MKSVVDSKRLKLLLNERWVDSGAVMQRIAKYSEARAAYQKEKRFYNRFKKDLIMRMNEHNLFILIKAYRAFHEKKIKCETERARMSKAVISFVRDHENRFENLEAGGKIV